MRSILSFEGRLALGELAARHALIAFDFDGTLAPFVATPGDAQIPDETRRLLRVASLLYPCAVISGRSRRDLAPRLDGIPLMAVVGNFGAEPGRGPTDRTRREQVVAWKRVLARELSLVPGIEIEDKVFSISVHFRNVPARPAARRLIADVAATLEGARVFRCPVVVNVIPSDAPEKGDAIAEVLERTGPRPALYVGDDSTDESAFGSPLVTVGVRVGRTSRSSAAWYVTGQGEIEAILRVLIHARTHLDGLGDRSEALARAIGA
jgi:trehalose 6-phosphate phosphatase